MRRSGTDLQIDLRRAVEEFVSDGSTVYIGNFGAQLFAVGHELIRQGRRSLHVVMSSGGILLDQLIASNVVDEVTFAHCWSPVGPYPAWNFRRMYEGGSRVLTNELTLGMLNSALTASAWGVPFLPIVDFSDTGYIGEGWANHFVTQTTCEFGRTWVVRALPIDVAFVHVDGVDQSGNGVVRGPFGEVREAAQAADRVVVVAEELVDDEDIRQRGPAAAIPGLLASAVVIEPLSLHPDCAAGRYDRDTEFYEIYAAATRSDAGLSNWLRSWVLDVPNRSAYRGLLTSVGYERRGEGP